MIFAAPVIDGHAQHVGQHEPALGVGVVDFDRPAVAGREHVAQLVRRRAGHVFDQAHQADHVDRQLEPGDRLHRAEHGRGAGHVALHREHRVGRLERQAAGVERHALADERQQRVASLRRLDSAESPTAARGPNRGRRPTANRSAPFPSRGWSQISAFSPHCFGHFFGLGGERFGIHVLRRLVHQPAREIDAFAEDPAALDRRRIAAGPEQLRSAASVFSRPDKGLAPGSRRSRRRPPPR